MASLLKKICLLDLIEKSHSKLISIDLKPVVMSALGLRARQWLQGFGRVLSRQRKARLLDRE